MVLIISSLTKTGIQWISFVSDPKSLLVKTEIMYYGTQYLLGMHKGL
jgi:hypothetical protein